MKGKTRSETLSLIHHLWDDQGKHGIKQKLKNTSFPKEREYANYKLVVFLAWHLLVNTCSKSNLFNAQNSFSMNISQKFQGVNQSDTLNYTTHPITPPTLCSLCSQWVIGGEGWSLAQVHTYTTALLYAWGICMCRFPHLWSQGFPIQGK